ncbi:hypothetical protein PAPYR_202 [Paratrimastix pyriformis]|uniref:Uncharacterized protein n=1 Tax=Paratrimastix pyriformis TaxID=342808 RepID=A0ABQ8UV43_9EUKA|nr:hypothetical protein PAPYR_202 [Paratrimastix pyriformis]
MPLGQYSGSSLCERNRTHHFIDPGLSGVVSGPRLDRSQGFHPHFLRRLAAVVRAVRRLEKTHTVRGLVRCPLDPEIVSSPPKCDIWKKMSLLFGATGPGHFRRGIYGEKDGEHPKVLELIRTLLIRQSQQKAKRDSPSQRRIIAIDEDAFQALP